MVNDFSLNASRSFHDLNFVGHFDFSNLACIEIHKYHETQKVEANTDQKENGYYLQCDYRNTRLLRGLTAQTHRLVSPERFQTP